MAKIAVVLFNIGGPDTLPAVRPFLFNLFSDPAIITWPNPFRQLIARLITHFRAEKAYEIYSLIGGGSPILDTTIRQAEALESELNRQAGERAHGRQDSYRVFVSMRYWQPFSSETVRE